MWGASQQHPRAAILTIMLGDCELMLCFMVMVVCADQLHRSTPLTLPRYQPSTMCSEAYRSIVYVRAAIDIRRPGRIAQRAYPSPGPKSLCIPRAPMSHDPMTHCGDSHVWKVFDYFEPVSATNVPETFAIRV